jgi:Transposase
MSESEYQFFVGVDWGSATHVVCVLGPDRQLIGERSVPHTGIGLTALADELTALAPAEPGRIAVAIEVPRGAIVDTLLDRGLHVFSLNPKQLNRFRDRHTVAGAKDDRRDAFVLATHCAPIVRPSGACSPTTPASWSCASCHGWRTTWVRSSGASATGCGSSCTGSFPRR